MRRLPLAFCLAATLIAAGCRQPDGPLPVETDDDPNRISDVAKDLLNAAGGDANAPSELAEDVQVWAASTPEAKAECLELARRVAAAVKGKNLSEPSAGQLARHLWIAAAGRELSGRQVDRLQEEVTTLLTTAGVDDAPAEEVSDQIDKLQETVTAKQRWWFQVF